MIRRFHEFFESRFLAGFCDFAQLCGVTWRNQAHQEEEMSLARQITCAAYSLPHVHRAAHRRDCRFRHQPLRRRRSESARSPPLCTLPLVPAGEIEGRPNQPFYDHIYFTRMAWQQSFRRRPLDDNLGYLLWRDRQWPRLNLAGRQVGLNPAMIKGIHIM